jgi:hypothetical protein
MRALVIVLLLLAIGPIAIAQPRRPITIAHEFHVSEAGEPIRTLKQMSKTEFQAIINAGCASLGQACREGKEQIRQAASVPGTIIAEGQNVYITGRVVRQEGEQWWGIFDAPRGYTACGAALSRVSLSEGSIFNTRIESGPDFRGLSFYAVVPAGRPNGGNWINAYFLVHYVPIGTEARLKCMPNGSNPWLCKGTKDCQRIVGSLN